MRLALIGISGSGKSRWAKKLAEKGFKRFCCTVVHLSTPAQVQEQMLKAYIADQRPVLWRAATRDCFPPAKSCISYMQM